MFGQTCSHSPAPCRSHWLCALPTALALGAIAPVTAQERPPHSLPPIDVVGTPQENMSLPVDDSLRQGESLEARRRLSNDATSLLGGIPGVQVQSAGGVSGLPSIRGLVSDRVLTLVNGMPLTASCPNHMNPAMSYIDPAAVDRIEVFAGLTPVSRGGDSIGGTISVESAPPVFAAADRTLEAHGHLTAGWRSVANSFSLTGKLSAATQAASLSYEGAFSNARNYRRGGDRHKVASTLYESQNHVTTLGIKSGSGIFTLRAGVQYIPYQGFPNQRMDMTGNRSTFIDGRYAGRFDWGNLDVTLYWQRVNHIMNFLDDKGGSATGGMPMITRSTGAGYDAKAELPLSARDTLRLGNAFNYYMLDDWWPPVTGKMMMSPETFWNINSGTRHRLGSFAEWEARWTPAWSTLFGIRNDTVWMNTGTVQGYNAMSYGADAMAFNAKDRSKTDINFDLTAQTRYEVLNTVSIDAGYGRKSRSPNLYERYSWSTNNMASSMITWVGDANMYIGNPALKPEVAHTVSASVSWHDPSRKLWEVRIAPYFTYIEDYIGQKLLTNVTMNGQTFAKVSFTNQDAELFGVDLSARARIHESDTYGRLDLHGVLGWVRGFTVSGGRNNLYQMMPINARLAAEHRLGGWQSTAEIQLVDDKTQVNNLLYERRTPGYALINLRTSYNLEHVRFDLGIENLLNKMYYLPLGGVSFGDWKGSGFRGPLGALPGPGRSVNVAMTVRF